jgi:hypothetical protein
MYAEGLLIYVSAGIPAAVQAVEIIDGLKAAGI